MISPFWLFWMNSIQLSLTEFINLFVEILHSIFNNFEINLCIQWEIRVLGHHPSCCVKKAVEGTKLKVEGLVQSLR